MLIIYLIFFIKFFKYILYCYYLNVTLFCNKKNVCIQRERDEYK